MQTDLAALDGAFWLTALCVFVLVLASGFFSGSETALTSASRGKLRHRADQGSRVARRALEVTEDRERLIGSVLLGNNLVNILATALATSLFTRLFGDSGVALATLVMTVVILVLAEVLPKTYAISRAEDAAAFVAYPIGVLVRLLYPTVSAVRFLVRGVLSIFGVRIDPSSMVLSVREEIAGAISLGHDEGVVPKEHRDQILGALDLSDRVVEEIMLHRSNIETIDANAKPENILKKCQESSHTRLPVYENEADDIIGVVHAKELLREIYKLIGGSDGDASNLKKLDVKKVMKPPYFVPDTTTLDLQMREFLKRREHFALVVDEYGSLKGLVTLEDIIEEIVGEITDEYDTDEEVTIQAGPDGAYELEGNTTIRDLNRATDWSLPDDEANTVAGLVIHEAQMIPDVGQVFEFHGFRFEVTSREGNRISGLRIKQLSAEPSRVALASGSRE